MGTTTVTFTATDAAGRTDSCSMTVTVTDNQDPVVTCPGNITVNAAAGLCNANVTVPLATASDNCSISSISNDFNGGGANASGTYPVGTTTVTFTATDAAGRTDSCSMTVTVTDNQDPVFNCASLSQINYSADVSCVNNTNVSVPQAIDNCGGTINAVGTRSDGVPLNNPWPLGTTTIIWTFTDAAANSIQCTQDVVVSDSIPPTAICKNITIPLNASTGTATLTATQIDNGSSDNCGIASMTVSKGSFDCSNIGANTVTLTVTDTAGNSSTCNATVTVTDASTSASVNIAASPGTTICAGTSVTFTATPTNGGTPSYQWLVDGNPVGTNSNTYTTSGLINANQVKVVMTSNLFACPVTSNVITMTVNALKPVSFTINGPNTICAGQSVTFTPSGITNGGASPTYQWLVDGNPAATTQNFTTSSLTNGNVVTLEVTSYVQCASPIPATSSNSIAVTVNPLPTLSTSDGSVCASSQTNIDLNSLVTSYGTVTFYNSQANADNGTSAISATQSPGVNTTYYVRSELGTGCFVTDTILISVTPLPTVDAGPDQSICAGSSFDLSSIGSGTNRTYYTTQANANSASSPISPPTVTPGSTTTYYVRSDNSGCYNTDSVIITVNPVLTPSVSISASTTSICSTTNVTFTATPTNGGSSPTYQWLVNGSPVGSNSPTYSTTTLSNNAVVTVQMATSEPCNNNALVTSNAITMTVYTTPAVPGTISGLSGVCPPSNGLVYSVPADPNIQSYTWTFPTGFTVTSGAGTNSITVDYNSNLVQSNVPIRVTATNLCGTSTYSELLISTDTFLYVNAGPDQNICAGTTQVLLDGTIGGVITRVNQWAYSSSVAGGTFPTDNKNKPILDGYYQLPNSVGPGDTIIITIYSTTNTNNTCSGAVSDTMEIHILPDPTASVSGTTTICEGSSTGITFTATPNTTVTYNTNQTINVGASGTAILNTGPLSTNTTYSLVSVGYTASPSCSKSASGSAIVTVNTAPTVNAGPDFSICEGSTATMSATRGGSATSGTWTSSSGNNTGFSNNSTTAIYTPNATDITNGSVTLTYTTNDPAGPCTAVSDSMILTINQAPTVNAGPDFTICEGSTATMSATLGGSATSGTWSSSSSGASGFSNNSTTAVYTPNATDISNGTVTLTYTTNDPSGPCASVSDTMVLTINPAAVVDAGPDQTICTNETPTFTATLSGGAASGTWTRSGSGVINSPNSTTTTYTPSASDISNGTVTLTFTSNNPSGPCAATSDSVILTIKEEIIIYTQPENVGICENNATSLSVVAGGDDLSYQWYFNGGSGFVTTGTNSNILNFSPATLANAGSYYVVISNSGGYCSPVTSDTATLNVNENISVDVSSQPVSGTRCENDSYTFTVDANGTVDTWQWYKVSSPSNIAISGANGTGNTATLNLINLSPTDSGNYYVEFSGPPIGNCGTVSSQNGTLTVNPLPTVNAGPNQTICSNDTVTMAGSIGGSASAGIWTSNGTGTFSPNNTNPNAVYSPTASDISNGSVNLTYTTTNATSPCGNVSDFMVLTIDPLPTATISYSSTTYCESDIATYGVTLNQNNGATGTYSYTVNSGGPTLNLNTSSGLLTPNGSSIGTYTIIYTIPATAVCNQVTTTTTVEIEAEPNATFSYPASDYCNDGTDPTPTVTQSGGVFSASPGGLSINPSTGAIDLSTSSPNTYTVYYTFAAVSNGCGQVQETQNITIAPYVASGATVEGYAIDDMGNPGPVSSQIIACHEGNGELTLTIDPSYAQYITQWEYLTSGGSWQPVPGLNAGSLTYDFTGLDGVTAYRVLIDTGAGCNAVYSATAYISVIPANLKPEPVQAAPTAFCYGDSSVFTSSTNYGAELLNSGGLFNTGQINTQDPNSWLVDGAVRGLSAAGNNLKNNNWSGTNPHPLTVAGIGPINWDSGEPKYAIAGGVLNQNQTNDPYYYEGGVAMTTLTTPIFSLMTLQDATFTFDEAFILAGANSCNGKSYPAGQALLQVSTDGGSTWNNFSDDEIVDTSWRTGSVVTGTSPTPVNSGNLSNFNVNTTTVDLSAYFGQTQMRIRFVLVRNCESVWALDNITLPGGNAASTVEWTDQFMNVISTTNTATVTPITPGYQKYTVTTYINGCRSLAPEGSEDVYLTVDYAYAGADKTISGCGMSANLHAYDNTKSARLNWQELTGSSNWVDGLYAVPGDIDHDYPGTGATGEWSITSGPSDVGVADWTAVNLADYFFPSNTDPRAEFAAPGGQYTLTWTVYGSGGNCSDSVVLNLTSCATIDFDGIDDNITFRNDFNLNSGPFSIEVWVKPDPTTNAGGANNALQTILSKRNGANNAYDTGYDLMLIGNKIYFNWNNGLSFTHSNTISTNRWYHVAVTYDGSNNYNMYIDGILLGSATGPPPTANTFECIMGAMDQAAALGNTTPRYYYSGWLDELRIWSVELSVNQIRHMMNQEIVDNGGNVQGAIVPINIPGPPSALSWANLRGYYRMNTPGDIANGYLLANAGTRDGQMRNITTWQLENPPIPYTTKTNGNWNTTGSGTPWTFGDSVWNFPNSTGINGASIDWNIVRTGHNVISNTQDVTVLGLLVDSNELTITAPGTQNENNSGHGLWVTHYLKLDGFMNLVGESQLVQKRYIPTQVNESLLDVASAGYLKRDQQGTTNLFNYNYWGSPVGPTNTTANNLNYSLSGNFRDGTVSGVPKTILWTNSYDATGSTDPNPITLSRRWIYTYANKVSNTYSAWDFKGETGTIAVGLGYTMKGSGVGDPITDVQNYSYQGKPNNNTNSNLVSPGNGILVGNPYPCAIDANAFIIENGPGGTNSISGALYFWDHYQSNATHILRDYQGGYAVRNISGGLAALSPPPTTDGIIIIGGTGTKVPGRYVPVAQGFFVSASDVGGQVTFNNSQRVFQRETNDNSDTGSSFFRYNDGGSSKEKSKQSNKSSEDNIKRIRIEFKTPDGAKRPLLLAFMPNNVATDGVDYGYDAPNNDSFPNDLSWLIDNKGYVIQGVGEFDQTKQYPLNMVLTKNGNVEIALTDLENFEKPINVFVYDSLLGTYTKLNDFKFQMGLDAKNYKNRFFITFQKENGTLSVEDKVAQNIIVNYLSSTNEIYVKTINSIEIRQIYLINMIGQTIKSWNATNFPMSNDEIRIPVSNISEGNYILKVETSLNTVNKKIIIRF
ncbi:LamG-like jellyroll fold domain-containing protein [Flavobacteriaceae bacterium LMO-SS05]